MVLKQAMIPAHESYKLLGLSFYKQATNPAFNEFEQLFMYSLNQVLQWRTDIQFVDQSHVPNLMILDDGIPVESQIRTLHDLSHRFDCNYVLYGSMDLDVGPANYLDNVILDIRLYNCTTQRHLFQLRYEFNHFETKPAKALNFGPSLDGLNELVQWLSFHLVGALQPQRALYLWDSLKQTELVQSLSHLQHLTQIHYYNGPDALSHRFSTLMNLIHQEPSLFLAHHDIGLIQKKMKNYAQATKSLETAYQLLPPETPHHQKALLATEIGICSALAMEIDTAKLWWKKAIENDSGFINPYMNLAHCYEEEGSMPEAEYYFIQAGKVAPDDFRICFNLARLYSKQEQWDKAIQQYEAQLLYEPDNAWVYSNLANCYLQQGSISDAKQYLEKTLELDPNGEAGRCANLILSSLQAAEV